MDEEVKVSEEQQQQQAKEPEQVDVKALLEEVKNLKKTLSEKNSEAAGYKRQLREKQTEDERKEAERAEREAQREARIKELEEKERINSNTERLIGIGSDPDSARAIAKALPEGVKDEYFEAMKALYEKTKQAAIEGALKSQPQPSTGEPPKPEDAMAKALAMYAGL